MSSYLKDRAAADALAKSLLPDDEMRHIVCCSAPIPKGKNHEFLTLREEIVVKSIRRATAKAAGACITALEAENAELRKDAERYRFLLEHGGAGCTEKDGYGGRELCMGEDLDEKVDAATTKPTGSAS